MQGSALPELRARLLTHPSVYELIQEHISKIGVITQSFLCGCECVSGHEYVKDGKWMRPQISEQILWRLFIYSFENPGAPLSRNVAPPQICSLNCSILFSLFLFMDNNNSEPLWPQLLTAMAHIALCYIPCSSWWKVLLRNTAANRWLILSEWCFRAPI